MTSLVLADIQKGTLSEATRRIVAAAVPLDGPIDVLVAGFNVGRAAEAAARLQHVRKVLVADSVLLEHDLAEPLGTLLCSLATAYSAILSSAASTAKNVMPRVAALLDVMQISEITKVVSPNTFERPIYAGNAILTVQSKEAIRVITVRASSFEPVPDAESQAPLEHLQHSIEPGHSRFESSAVSQKARPELTSAKIVISGGRALQSAENFEKLINPIADHLGAAIGASRAAVDAGFAPNDLQVGQTGKVVAPELYIAVGISGAIQHLAGMKDSKVIVAINRDEEAPIFQVADYGLVQDLFTALPELAAELAKARA